MLNSLNHINRYPATTVAVKLTLDRRWLARLVRHSDLHVLRQSGGLRHRNPIFAQPLQVKFDRFLD